MPVTRIRSKTKTPSQAAKLKRLAREKRARIARAVRETATPTGPRGAGPGTAGDLRTLRHRHAIPQAMMARLLDVSLRTATGLEAGDVPAARVTRNLTQARRLCSALAEAMDSSFVGPWLDTPNEMLDGLKPLEAMERGKIDLVWQIAEGLRIGSGL